MLYFRHLTNAQRDPKLGELITLLGLEGYGLYFVMLELIAEQMKTKDADPSHEATWKEWRKTCGFNRNKLEKCCKILETISLFSIEKTETKMKVTAPNLRKIMQLDLGRTRRKQDTPGPNPSLDHSYSYNDNNITPDLKISKMKMTNDGKGRSTKQVNEIVELAIRDKALRSEEEANIPALQIAIIFAMNTGLNEAEIVEVMDRNRFMNKYNKDPATGRSYMPSLTKVLTEGRSSSILAMSEERVREIYEQHEASYSKRESEMEEVVES